MEPLSYLIKLRFAINTANDTMKSNLAFTIIKNFI